MSRITQHSLNLTNTLAGIYDFVPIHLLIRWYIPKSFSASSIDVTFNFKKFKILSISRNDVNIYSIFIQLVLNSASSHWLTLLRKPDVLYRSFDLWECLTSAFDCVILYSFIFMERYSLRYFRIGIIELLRCLEMFNGGDHSILYFVLFISGVQRSDCFKAYFHLVVVSFILKLATFVHF